MELVLEIYGHWRLKETTFLFQRVWIAVQHGNVVFFQNTMVIE